MSRRTYSHLLFVKFFVGSAVKIKFLQYAKPMTL